MSHTAGSVARLGVGFGVIAVATLGLIVSTPTPAVDVVGCAHVTSARADYAEAAVHETDCAEAVGEIADLASTISVEADTATSIDELADQASAAQASADTATIVVKAC